MEQPKTRRRNLIKMLIAALGALGILSGIGAYYLPGILKSDRNLIIKRPPPLEASASLAQVDPNYVFSRSVTPTTVPTSILREALGDNPAYGTHAFAIWAEQHGGIIVAPKVRLILHTHGIYPVIITNLTIQITRHYPAKAGWFNAWYGCGGVIEVPTLEVNLDKRPFEVGWLSPTVMPSAGTSVKQPTLRVTDKHNEVIDVQVYTEKPVVMSWVINISYSSAGGEGTLRVDNHGKSFVVTSLLGSVGYSLRSEPKLVRDHSVDPNPNAPGGGMYNPDIGTSMDGTETC